MDLKSPKKKRFGGKIPKFQPLPVLFENISGISASNSLWPMYIGTFSGDSVIITSKDEMTSLYNMGCFGKGSISRGYPTFGESKKGIPPVIQKRQWKRRKIWMDQLLSFNSMFNSDDNDSNDSLSRNDGKSFSSNKKMDSSDFEDVQIIDIDQPTNDLKDKIEKQAQTSCSDVCDRSVENSRKINSKNVVSNKKNFLDNPSSSINVAVESSFCNVSDLDKNNTKLYDSSSNHVDTVIVIDDSGSDEEQQLQCPKPCLYPEPVKTAVETLNLTLEEAFFLSFGLGCLQVVDLQGIFLSLRGMWHLYRDSQPDFISSYVTYHYFRSKGWVVKPGAKFGGQFLLYKQGPSFYHASYLVVVEEINNKFSDSSIKRQLTWTKILGLNRITETVGKEIIISQVQWPTNITEEELSNPKVISKFKVQEVLLRRWNSRLERQEKDLS